MRPILLIAVCTAYQLLICPLTLVRCRAFVVCRGVSSHVLLQLPLPMHVCLTDADESLLEHYMGIFDFRECTLVRALR